MNLRENIRIALDAIRANKMRSFLTMLGIIIGVGSVIAIMTIGDTGKNFLITKINEAGGQSVTIETMSSERYNIDGLTEEDLELLGEIDIVQYVVPEITTAGVIQTKRVPDGTAYLNGVNDDYQQAYSIKINHGRWFTEAEIDSHARVCLVSQKTSEKFFGRSNAVGETIDVSIDDQLVTLKIVGISTDTESSLFSTDDLEEMMSQFGMEMDFSKIAYVYVPVSTILDVYGETSYSGVSIITYDVNDLDKAADMAKAMLNAHHGVLDDSVYKATNNATLVDLLDTVINVFTIFIACVSAISLIVGGVGVMNIMLVSVTERTREIGIRKALGARTDTILLQFLTESVIICLIGGLIGMALGYGLSCLAALLMGATVTVNVSTFLIAVGFSSAIGIFFGIYPARKAAKMPPIEALRRD